MAKLLRIYQLQHLDFADDIALLESTIRRAQAQLSRTAAAAEVLQLQCCKMS